MKDSADQAAFEELYRQHYWALLRFATRRCPDSESARDLVAETFTLAWRRRTRIPPDRPLPWLYRVAGNLNSNQRRRSLRSATALRRLVSFVDREQVPPIDEQVERSAELTTALALLRTLGNRDQEVLLLHAWEDLRGADLAAALGCSASAAAARLHRARHRLRTAREQSGQATDPTEKTGVTR